ncbi:unspecific monooxygenase [Ancylostoma ceylanicum]|uniref:Unspecific monooxygenase n=1 Tax=Ancylostoma ceylanicum TaxID=53326 RepID=A0A0D6MAW1_9BILA|nr:unspecific monooxygenase [Ancylostoma ceylanicum]
MFLIAVLFIISATALYLWLFYQDVKRYPKGPTPLPIFGNILSVDFRKLHEQLSEYSKVYGNVFTVWLPRPHVVIADYEGIKEAFAKKGRSQPDPELSNRSGENWKEQRRISLHILRDFGMGKNLMEEQVLLSAQEFLAHMASVKNKEAIDMRHPIQVFVANIINKTLFGFSYEYDKSDRLMASVDQLNMLFDEMKGSKLTMFAQMFPFVHRLPVIGHFSKDRFERMTDLVKKNIKEDVERCLKTYNPDQEPECFVQAYYQKMQTNSELNYDNLLNVCMDFFLAGMETTSTTLRWSTLFMAKHTNVQDKIRQEIFSVLGADGKPSTSLRSRMPYTNAAIQEIQRCANIVPLNVTHRTVKDTSVESVPIPRDTFVIGHIQHIMAHSPVYKDADKFKPERFLMDDGVTSNGEATEQLCPFSIGKRQCAGEGLAKVELFIGLITLLQNYKIEPAEGRTIDLEPIFAAVLLPKPQLLRVTPVSN